ncbi:hypothetical protein HanPI659440_Chr17g0684661 [Helianthus annuus]|nr:hypothetical protein HanPI659440_Chr17g0684661 [Helianthus annuus]
MGSSPYVCYVSNYLSQGQFGSLRVIQVWPMCSKVGIQNVRSPMSIAWAEVIPAAQGMSCVCVVKHLTNLTILLITNNTYSTCTSCKQIMVHTNNATKHKHCIKRVTHRGETLENSSCHTTVGFLIINIMNFKLLYGF